MPTLYSLSLTFLKTSALNTAHPAPNRNIIVYPLNAPGLALFSRSISGPSSLPVAPVVGLVLVEGDRLCPLLSLQRY
jgi:hypothetical protein